jgi:ubiquitin-like domain-containing CTD phosphatase 1
MTDQQQRHERQEGVELGEVGESFGDQSAVRAPNMSEEAAAAAVVALSMASSHAVSFDDSSGKKGEPASDSLADSSFLDSEAQGEDGIEGEDDDEDDDAPTVTLIAKFNKEKYEFPGWSIHTTIGEVKDMIQRRTNILPKRQKLVGLLPVNGIGIKSVTDDLTLGQLKVKSTASAKNGTFPQVITHSFILMGTPEAEIFVDPQDRRNRNRQGSADAAVYDVIDDFDLDFNAGSTEWLRHVANTENLKKFTVQTAVYIMHEPRPGKPLLVLDLDHTLLDFSSRTLQRDLSTARVGSGTAVALMKRPYMDQFLTACYVHYDLVVWSQTSWRWLETKLTELGMLTHSGYKFCFVLDKTSMFTVTSTKRDIEGAGNGEISVQHHVKPLQIIWSKFPNQWNTRNTVHIDDLQRNFALNPQNGKFCTASFDSLKTL